jgi:hypothetical protein
MPRLFSARRVRHSDAQGPEPSHHRILQIVGSPALRPTLDVHPADIGLEKNLGIGVSRKLPFEKKESPVKATELATIKCEIHTEFT